MRDKRTLILGVGNDILTDDGIGSRLVTDLIKLINRPDILFNTACCGGLEIVEYIKDFKRVILVDAIRTQGGRPGDVYYFIPSDFRETSHLSNMHDVSFLTALELYDTLNLSLPDEIHIIAVEIAEDMIFSEEFTLQLKERYPGVLEKVLDIIKEIII
jgi:hydrogenase maturation protease